MPLCSACFNACLICSNSSTCLQCQSNNYLGDYPTNSTCVSNCPEGQRQNTLFGVCQAIDEQSLCNTELVESLEGDCVSNCEIGSYLQASTRKCFSCYNLCQYCTGSAETDCLAHSLTSQCHYSCSLCYSSGYAQCVQCSGSRTQYLPFQKRNGECVCDEKHAEIGIRQCENSSAPAQIRLAVIVLAVATIVLLVTLSVFEKNLIILMKFIDQMQFLSYLMYINNKSVYQLDQIWWILNYFHPTNLVPQPFSTELLTQNVSQQTTQVVKTVPPDIFDYSGNPKLYGVGEKVPNFIVSGGLLLVLHGLFWALLAIAMIVAKIGKSQAFYFTFQSFKMSERKRSFIVHTSATHLFVQTCAEFMLLSFMQFVVLNEANEIGTSDQTNMGQNGDIVACVSCIYFLAFVMYLIFRHWRKIQRQRQKDKLQKDMGVVESEEKNRGISSEHNAVLLLRKMLLALTAAIFYQSALLQVILISSLQYAYFVYFIVRRPVKDRIRSVRFIMVTETIMVFIDLAVALTLIEKAQLFFTKTALFFLILLFTLYIFYALVHTFLEYFLNGCKNVKAASTQFSEYFQKRLEISGKALFDAPPSQKSIQLQKKSIQIEQNSQVNIKKVSQRIIQNEIIDTEQSIFKKKQIQEISNDTKNEQSLKTSQNQNNASQMGLIEFDLCQSKTPLNRRLKLKHLSAKSDSKNSDTYDLSDDSPQKPLGKDISDSLISQNHKKQLDQDIGSTNPQLEAQI